MTYSIHLFKLARLNSEIKYVMHSICRDPPRYAYPPVIDIHEWQKEMIDRLEEWLSSIPRTPRMEHIAKFCEIRYHEMMILVLRPSPGIPDPSEDLLRRCFEHAIDLLRGYGELYRQEALLYSRLVVHSIFLSTLIMLHCLWRLPRVAEQVQIEDLMADTGISLNILSSIGEYWAEAKRARDCIQEISGATVQRLIKARALDIPVTPSSAQPQATAGRTLRSQHAHGAMEQSPGQIDSGIDVAPAWSSMDSHDFNPDTSWLNDTLPGGFMDIAGAPDWDSMMWEIFNNS